MTSFTFTLVKLTLTAGTIWTKATHLDTDSEFEIYTTDSTAAVRWTIFVVSTNWNTTDTLVIEWEVDVFRNTDIWIIKKLKDWESIVTDNWREIWISKIEPNTIPVFLVNNSIRDEETERNIALNEDEAEVSEIIPTCTPSEIPNLITWIKTIITCDAYWNSIEDKYCIDNTKDFNADKTACININCVDVDWEQVCEEIDWYTLVWYAPYNNLWNVKLYKSLWNIEPFTEYIVDSSCHWISYQCSSNKDTFWAIAYNKYNSFVEYNSNKWILINNDWSSDKLKYSLSDFPTSDNDIYRIELNVRAVDLNQTWWRYIFDNQDNKWLYINKISWSNYFQIRYNWNLLCYDWWATPCNFSFAGVEDETQFETIRVTNWEEIEIGWGEFTIPWVTTNYLYLGSKNNFEKHFNWIIDYLKIYRN